RWDTRRSCRMHPRARPPSSPLARPASIPVMLTAARSSPSVRCQSGSRAGLAPSPPIGLKLASLAWLPDAPSFGRRPAVGAHALLRPAAPRREMPPAQVPPMTLPRLPLRRFLVADDDREVRLGVAELLDGLGLEILHAESGREAV